MNKKNPLLNTIQNLLEIHKKDKNHHKDISNIFMNLSELFQDNVEIKSFCIDASIVIGEAVYKKPTVMSFAELEEEFKKLIK